MPTHEPEITEAVLLCQPDGTLNPGAVGWSREPLHDCALPGSFGRRKRWDYWCITAEPLVVQITLLNADLMRMGTVAVFDTTGGPVREALAVRGPGAMAQPDHVDGGPARLQTRGLTIEATPEAGGTRLRASFRWRGEQVELDALVAPAEDSLNVVVPWSENRYQFTSKHVGRACRGTVSIDGVDRVFEGEAGFDFGRGRWPSATRWNWGAGFGHVDGQRLGLQVGGQWTDGTGMTENGVFLEGVLDKLGDRLVFEPGATWRVYSPDSGAVDLRFETVRSRPVWVPGIVRLDLVYGHWHGRVKAHGRQFEIANLFGWTEEMRVRW